MSGNRLRAIPTTILNCQRMHMLSAHSNCISTFPEVFQLPEIKVGQKGMFPIYPEEHLSRVLNH